MATKNIISGHQTMSIYKDTRLLAEKCVSMVQAVLEGTDPEINDTKQYNNNVLTVPSYLCTPVAVDVKCVRIIKGKICNIFAAVLINGVCS